MSIVRAILAGVLALMAAPALAGSVLYASDNDNIYRVDTATGTATLVGATGLSGFDQNSFGSILRDLTSTSGVLYGAQYNSAASGTTGALATINPATGMVTASVALTGLTGTNQGLLSIAYDASTGTLFGNTSRQIFTINPVTGAASVIGAAPTGGSLFGLGVNAASNTLYALQNITDSAGTQMANLLSLDKANGSVLSSVTLSDACACDIAFDPLTNVGYIAAQFFDADGNVTLGGLDRLNSSLTATTFVGPHGTAATFGVNGLAFFGVSAAPEPQIWMMMILGFGIAGFAMRRSGPRRLGTA